MKYTTHSLKLKKFKNIKKWLCHLEWRCGETGHLIQQWLECNIIQTLWKELFTVES